MTYNTPLDMLYRWEQERGDELYLSQPIGGKAHTWTWKEAGQEIRKMAAALKAMNFPPKSQIALVSKNCAHWIMCDLAIMMAGHVSVPLYPNLGATSMNKILLHSESKLLFVGKLDDWDTMRPGVPEGMPCISFPFYRHEEFDNWEDIIADKDPLEEDVLLEPQELVTIVYTSGTTGNAKGVMHNSNNIGFAAENAVERMEIGVEERFFSYLPLSHIAERLLVQMGSLYCGGKVFFAESIDTFPANLAAAKPTVFLAVHRIWTKFQQGILAKLSQRKLDILLRIPIISGVIKKKVKAGLGLGEARNIFTGASPTPVRLMEWYQKLGINIQEAYGSTEGCCYSHGTLNDYIKLGYVGAPWPKCDVKLGIDNEILIKHDGVMLGYFKEPQLTNEAFTKDGYLRTGDEGYIDNEGFLKITGRVKDLFKTSKGKYIAPSPIEMNIAGSKCVEQVCVVGTALPQPIALLVLSDVGKALPKEELTRRLKQTLSITNGKSDSYAHLQKMVVVSDEWSVENGVLTPSLKIKRRRITQAYKESYDDWYAQEGEILYV